MLIIFSSVEVASYPISILHFCFIYVESQPICAEFFPHASNQESLFKNLLEIGRNWGELIAFRTASENVIILFFLIVFQKEGMERVTALKCHEYYEAFFSSNSHDKYFLNFKESDV